jgi:hypothetical protein
VVVTRFVNSAPIPRIAIQLQMSMINPIGILPTTSNAGRRRMKAQLLPILQKQFGKSSVTAGRQFVDLKVRTKTRTLLIKITTEATAREAIRSTLGQLLDSAYFGVSPHSKQST